MKKFRFFLMLPFIMLLIVQSFGQQRNITSAMATKSKGYTVINTGEPITIYKYIHRVHAPKEAENYGPKYFFTTSNSDTLQSLTMDNLKKTFPNNHLFHDALDATFKDDKELTNYDSFHKMYKVNWLLKQHP